MYLKAKHLTHTGQISRLKYVFIVIFEKKKMLKYTFPFVQVLRICPLMMPKIYHQKCCWYNFAKTFENLLHI